MWSQISINDVSDMPTLNVNLTFHFTKSTKHTLLHGNHVSQVIGEMERTAQYLFPTWNSGTIFPVIGKNLSYVINAYQDMKVLAVTKVLLHLTYTTPYNRIEHSDRIHHISDGQQ